MPPNKVKSGKLHRFFGLLTFSSLKDTVTDEEGEKGQDAQDKIMITRLCLELEDPSVRMSGKGVELKGGRGAGRVSAGNLGEGG